MCACYVYILFISLPLLEATIAHKLHFVSMQRQWLGYIKVAHGYVLQTYTVFFTMLKYNFNILHATYKIL